MDITLGTKMYTNFFEHKGDILSLKRGILVQGCNAQGAMNSGIAKSIREMYPQVFDDYSSLVKSIENVKDRLGKIAFTSINNGELLIANSITQENYGRDPDVVYVSYDAMAEVFRSIKEVALERDMEVHFPLIGCGLANGEWIRVKSIIVNELGPDVKKHLWTLPKL